MGNTENKKPEEEKNEKPGVPMRTYLVMIIAGAYVAYLGISLCQGVINGTEGSNVGFLIAGVIFIVLGVLFVINGIRGSIKISKAQKVQAESEQKVAASEAAEEEKPLETKEKKMSIADRANLVSRMEDEEEPEK